VIDEWRVGAAVVAGGATLVPIERRWLDHGAGDAGRWVCGLVEPVAVVVCDAAGIRAFDAAAGSVPVESLVEIVPGLGATLAALSA